MSITAKVVNNLRGRGVEVVTRRQWGSEPSGFPWPLAPDVENVYDWRRERRPALQPADTVVQHITVTLDPGVTKGDFKEQMQSVERIGFERFGTGFPYNWGVDMTTGMVGVGMPLDAKGAHTINEKGVHGFSRDQNLVARAIAVLGMPETKFSKHANRSITQLLLAMIEEGAITRGFDYVPHSLFAAKDCPCDPTRSQMEEIRAKVARMSR